MKTSDLRRSELATALYSFRKEFIWVGIFSLIANILMLSPTLYMLQVYDRVLASQSELTLLFLTVIIVLFFCIMAFSEWLRSRLLVRAGVKFDHLLSTRAFNASFEDYLSQNQKNPTAAFSHLTNVRQFLTGNGIIALFDAPWTPIYILIVFMLHPWLGWLSIAFALIQLIMTYIGHRMTYPSANAVSNAEEKSREFLTSKLKNAESVEAMGMLANLRSRWLTHHINHQSKSNIANNTQNLQQSLSKFVRYSMQSLTLGAAAMLVIKGELSVGSMIASNVLIARALQPIDLIVASWKGFIQAKEAYLKLDELLKKHPERDADTHHPIPKGNILLKQLVAKTPSRTIPILNQLNAEFKAGQVTGIIGPSGSGKSTLARCLVGVWPDTQGLVLLDKTPIENWDREQLGPHIGYLPQDVELFDGTLAENIGRFEDPDSEKIIDAAKRAGIHEMILKFPMGYNTPAGEAGNMLSGGQKQRLGLARAIYNNPMLIVLDEPNANLDDLGEKALMQTIQDLKKQGKTVFLITHRPNILVVADYLLVLKDGEIAHYGTRNDVLMKLNNHSNKMQTSAGDEALKPA
jgi:ATP-binding cassette subfamily C exporter for protease/lipase